MGRKNLKPVFGYKLQVYDHVVTAAWNSTRAQRKLARDVYISRFGEEKFRVFLADALGGIVRDKDGNVIGRVKGGIVRLFEVYPEPVAEVLAYVQQLAYITDKAAFENRNLMADKDAGSKRIEEARLLEKAKPLARQALREWLDAGQNFVKGAEPPDPKRLIRSEVEIQVEPELAALLDKSTQTEE